MQNKEPKYRHIIKGVNHLSLGISIVVAIILGAGAGMLLKNIFDATWLLFLGLFWGISAAILNVYRAYKAHQKDFDEFKIEKNNIEKTLNKHNKDNK